MKIFYTEQFGLPLPEGHCFPMVKHARLRQRVAEAQLGGLIVSHPATRLRFYVPMLKTICGGRA